MVGEGEEVPDLFDSDLKDMDPFYYMYLIGYILEKLFRLSSLKCTLEWKVSDEVSFVDMGNDLL